jgi:hypothetical protein
MTSSASRDVTLYRRLRLRWEPAASLLTSITHVMVGHVIRTFNYATRSLVPRPLRLYR